MSKSVQDQIQKILEEYIDTERDKIEQITQEVAQDVANELKKTSPKSDRGGKHYRAGWRVQNGKVAGVRRTITSVVYNATKPNLTHLLSKEHDIKNQFGEYGRSKPDPHIANAEERGNELYLQRLEREL